MRRLLLGVVLGVGLSGAARAGSAPPSDPFVYAVFGLADATLGGAAAVERGDVGVNLGTLTLGPRARIVGMAAADTIAIKRRSRAGAFLCRVLDTPGAEVCSALTLPLVPPSTLTLVQVLPGALSVDVGRDGPIAPLPPGDYGSVQVHGRAQLVLAGGVAPYNVRDIRVGPRGRLVCAAACRIEVRDHVSLAGSTHVGGSATVDARIDVGGGAAPAFRAGPRAAVTAIVYAPSGTILLGGGGHYTGAFVGRSVQVGPRATVRTPAP